MIVERLPQIVALSTEDKAILAEELLHQVRLERDRDPALLDLLRTRLQQHESDPAGGVSWEELRERLLKRSNA